MVSYLIQFISSGLRLFAQVISVLLNCCLSDYEPILCSDFNYNLFAMKTVSLLD